MKVYIVAGEPSGDLLASGLMRALVRLVPGVKFRGIGGESMMAVELGGETVAEDASSNGLGGAKYITESQRFTSLFDIAEISVMGFFEVVPRLPLIMKRISQTIRDIEAFSPDVLVTVDSWGFVSALLTRLRKKWRREECRGRLTSQMPVVHYVAPQVWAWKKGRAKNVARLVDRLMTLLPDEGRWFEKYNLRSDFVGHPVVERIEQAPIDPDGFRAAHGIPASATVISVLPGSRHSEVKRLIPKLKEAVRQMAEKVAPQDGGGLKNRAKKATTGAAGEVDGTDIAGDDGGASKIFVIVPTVPGVEKQVLAGFEKKTFQIAAQNNTIGREKGVEGAPESAGEGSANGAEMAIVAAGTSIPVLVVTGEVNRYNAFAISDFAIAKSGTVSLELTALGVPHLIVYTFGVISNFIAKRLVNVRFANLLNIISGREIIPEFVLENCRPELISDCAVRFLGSRELAENQVVEAQKVMRKLRLPDVLPSDRAAQIVAEMARSKKTVKV